MSQSLNRIRSLVSEIEQIQKQGQRISRPVQRADYVPPVSEEELRTEIPSAALVADPQGVAADSPSVSHLEPRLEAVPEPRRSESPSPVSRLDLALENRVTVQWSGNLVLELVLPQNAEKIEMKQIGDWIEIRFSDGKAFHIPFKAVA